MFYNIKDTILDWLVPIYVCIIIICLGMLFTKDVYSANGQIPVQLQCVPAAEKPKVIKKLENELGEILIVSGLSSKDLHSIEVYLNPDTGTWTAIGTNLMKICILDYGVQGQIKNLNKLGQGV